MRLQDEVCYVFDRREFMKNEYKKNGYSVCTPYLDKTIIGRIFREFCFRVLKWETAWYNKEILRCRCRHIIIEDSLISRKYLEWLHERLPDAHLHFKYCNLIGKANHLTPDMIPSFVHVSTYDKTDSDKYNIYLRKNGGYPFSSTFTKKNSYYDVFFVGRDKGRTKEILALERKMKSIGLKTCFLIMPNGRFFMPKPYYSRPIIYDMILQYLQNSKAVLNFGLPSQYGLTIRDYESVFYELKLITNNPNIKNYDIYSKDNVFILGEDDIENLPAFLESPFVKIAGHVLEKYTLDMATRELVNLVSLKGCEE